MKILLLTLLLIGLPAYSAEKITYLIAIDGLSHESFELAKKRGLFKEFGNLSAHICPFPSMTDISWAEIVKTPKLFGSAGRIRSVEAVYFNESSKSIEGDVRDVYRRMAQPKYYLNAFEHIFNPYVEALMYFPTKEMARLEIENVLKDMASDPNPKLVTGYIGGIDSTAHTQHERLYPVLEILSEELGKFIAQRKKGGRQVEVILISDHGNVGSFREGEKEIELTPVELGPLLKKAGFDFVQRLEKPNDVAVPLMALGTWAPVYLAEKKNASKIIDEFKQYPWFDFAVQLEERSPEKIVISVNGSSGRAQIIFNRKRRIYIYNPSHGNPLHLGSQVFTEAAVARETRNGPYPDSLIRLIQAADSEHIDFPDMILTLKDGYYVNNSLSEMTKMYRTHGSLSRKSSLGIVATTGIELEPYLRSDQVLPALKIEAAALFGRTAELAKKSDRNSIKEAKALKGIPTGHRNFSQKRIFQQMTKVIADSRPFFVIDEIKNFLAAFSIGKDQNQMPSQLQALNPSQLQAKPLIDPKEIGEITDIVIKNPDITALQSNPKVISLQKKFGFDQSQQGSPEAQRAQAIGAKRAVMKIYQIPYLLDQSLVLQEKPLIQDTRDLGFAEYWADNSERLMESLTEITSGGIAKIFNWLPWRKNHEPTVPERLFHEIFKEKILEDRISPEPFNSFYKAVPQKATIVYVPGTYNGIFDREIFSLGLISLAEDLGLRVLKVPILSACNSEYNGDIVLNFLKEDQARYLERKEPPPKYIILGYSKGGVDSLYAFTKDSDFVKKNVLGLVVMASPLRGSEVLEKTDLPFTLVNLLIEENTPVICQKEKTIVSTGSIQAMNSFWRKNEQKLIGLTRYFSVTFVSKPEDSHLFMKITKVMGQFEEDNDGIVTISSTKFPPRLGAISLGIVEGDHLAGILSSRFPQKAFMRAVVTSLAELGIEDEKLREKAKYNAIMKSAPSKVEDKYAYAVNPHSQTVDIREYSRDGHMLSAKELNYDNAYDLNKIILGTQLDPAATYDPKVKLPQNQLAFDPYEALDVAKMVDILSAKKVLPILPQNYKQGLDFSFNHENFLFYRIDHQFSYENRSPVGADNNQKWGFEAVKAQDNSFVMALRSEKNSIRLTTLSYRFKVADFATMDLSLRVTDGPQGADPVKGFSGKDDSAFQIWFTLRDLRDVNDRSLVSKENAKVYFFGYYWGEDTPGRQAGQIFENYYSNKNIVVTTLPESYQLLLNNGKEKLGHWATYRQNIAEDIRKAFPKLDVDQLEVVAITYQMDSNDTGSKSEAFMKTLRFFPSTQQQQKN